MPFLSLFHHHKFRSISSSTIDWSLAIKLLHVPHNPWKFIISTLNANRKHTQKWFSIRFPIKVVNLWHFCHLIIECVCGSHTQQKKRNRRQDNDILWATEQLDISFMNSAALDFYCLDDMMTCRKKLPCFRVVNFDNWVGDANGG